MRYGSADDRQTLDPHLFTTFFSPIEYLVGPFNRFRNLKTNRLWKLCGNTTSKGLYSKSIFVVK
jgi:hypothetical protein